MDDVQITPDMIVFPQVLHGQWLVNVSIYEKIQILIMAQNRYSGTLITRVFYNPTDAAEFIELIGEYNE
jgi:hypothetical protein